MRKPISHRVLLKTGAILFSVLLAACDSTFVDVNPEDGDTDASGADASGAVDAIEDFDLDAMHDQVGESRVPGPSLGFALPPVGKIYARSGTVGAAVGNQFEVSCSNGKVLAGVKGNFSHRLESVQPICVSTNDAGQWTDTPVAEQNARGSNNGQAFTRQCATGHAVVGFTSDFVNRYPAYLQLHCRKLESKLVTRGDRVSLQTLGNIYDNAPTGRPQCADKAVATGLYGHSQNSIDRLGLMCFEDPAFAGRWSSRIDWPHLAIHSNMLSDGKILTFGTGGSGANGAMEYDVWSPTLGVAQSSHNTFSGVAQVNTFCSASTMLPDSGDVLISGGDANPIGRNNSGIRDATIYNASSASVSPAADMNYERWYPTSTALPNGDVLVTAGRDINNALTDIPEVYSASTRTWRTLDNASMSAYDYFYPRQFVMTDGRVFGVSSRRMFIMSTEGNGSIADVGQLPGYTFGASATAVMYEPGKILHAGGIAGNGIGAVDIDITSGSPVLTRAEDLAQPRRAWATTVSLADGKVMMVGGSYEINDDVTQSLGAEMWDPNTKKWTQYSSHELPRLYHSTAVLLMDGRVLVAGGGSPGPMENRNGEIFSPPYLFDANGSLAERPEITYAPEKASWGQSIDIRMADNSDVSRVTLIKTGSVTHGFNMDQRFLELNFNPKSDAVSVTMPASGNIAPRGYYMLFVHNADGTPSEAKMISLGNESAPATPTAPAPTTPLPTPSGNNLLVNSGFESGQQGWEDCAAPSATNTASSSVEGNASMKVSPGGCLFQVINVQPNTPYSLSCHTKGNALQYASLSLQMLDANYSEIASDSAVVDTAGFAQKTVSARAPGNAVYASATFYSEGTTHYDRCELVAQSATNGGPAVNPQPVTSNQISNGGFEQGKTDWFDCSNAWLTNETSDAANGQRAMEIKQAGCLYQEFPVTPGKTYELSCAAKSEATQYTSMALTIMNENYTTLGNDQKPVGQNFFQNYQAELFTPFEGRIGAVTLYSEDKAQFDDCSVVER